MLVLKLDCLKQSSLETDGRQLSTQARCEFDKTKRLIVPVPFELDCFKQSSLDRA
jgi:hypothetical protein